MSILTKLYHEWYEMKSGERPDRGAAQKRFCELWAQAEARLDREFSEELRASIFDYMDDECCNDFRAGFCIGALLTAEVYTAARS